MTRAPNNVSSGGRKRGGRKERIRRTRERRAEMSATRGVENSHADNRTLMDLHSLAEVFSWKTILVPSFEVDFGHENKDDDVDQRCGDKNLTTTTTETDIDHLFSRKLWHPFPGISFCFVQLK